MTNEKEKENALECLMAILQCCKNLSEITEGQLDLLSSAGYLDPTAVEDSHRFLERRVKWLRENARYTYR